MHNQIDIYMDYHWITMDVPNILKKGECQVVRRDQLEVSMLEEKLKKAYGCLSC